MPWAAKPETREKYLRREASWRRIPLASPSGKIMRRLQAVTLIRSDFPDLIDMIRGEDIIFNPCPEDLDCFHREEEPKGGVTLGYLYEVITERDAGYQDTRNPGYLSGAWKVLFETRVGNRGEFHEFQHRFTWGDFTMRDESEIMHLLVRAERFALILVLGGGPKERCTGGDGEEENVWEPQGLEEKVAVWGEKFRAKFT